MFENQSNPSYGKTFTTPKEISTKSEIVLYMWDTDGARKRVMDRWTINPNDINGDEITYLGTKTVVQNRITFRARWIYN